MFVMTLAIGKPALRDEPKAPGVDIVVADGHGSLPEVLNDEALTTLLDSANDPELGTLG
jgi:hypothetical protein